MKVAFIGAHGVGKTVLVYEQAARFKREGVNVEIVGEVARRCPLPINEKTTLEAQTWVLMTQIAEEISAQNAELIICDRSVLDNFAYLKRVAGPSQMLTEWLYEWINTYDLLIKVPIVDTGIQADGVRNTNMQFAIEIDQLIDALGLEFATMHNWRNLSSNRNTWNDEAYTLIKGLLCK